MFRIRTAVLPTGKLRGKLLVLVRIPQQAKRTIQTPRGALWGLLVALLMSIFGYMLGVPRA
ncbi:hypothetical protein LINGRAPRIM_LOCUS568 [Linum grandiflorum]